MPIVPDEPHWAADIQEEKYLPNVVMRACQNFEYFYGLDLGTATPKMIDTKSSLTVAGWADVVLIDYGQTDIESEYVVTEVERQGARHPVVGHVNQTQLMEDMMMLPLRLLAITMSRSPSSLALWDCV